MAELSVSVVFNNQTYNLIYNEQTGYYEATIDAPSVGGIYEAEVTFYDVLNDEYQTTKDVQILKKVPVELNIVKDFLWIFDYQTFAVKDIVEIASFEIIMDEETNENSTIKVLKDTGAKGNDIVAVKRNNDVIYWGIIEEIQNEDGKNTYIFVCKYITNMFDRKILLVSENMIRQQGIEKFIKKAIIDNFVDTGDSLLNLDYLNVTNSTNTTKQVSVSNVENNLYNLHTWMNNCTQNYGVVYDFEIEMVEGEPQLHLDIAIKSEDTELIDVKAMNITNYEEVFETDIVAKVEVYGLLQGTVQIIYTLYLKTDRTTTTDPTDVDRALGRVEAIYVENNDEASQDALNTMKGNTYNHNISFSLDRYIPLGTPIAIKTQKSIVYNTYISSVKMTSSKFFEYQCGNIRINFIEKLLKERNK